MIYYWLYYTYLNLYIFAINIFFLFSILNYPNSNSQIVSPFWTSHCDLPAIRSGISLLTARAINMKSNITGFVSICIKINWLHSRSLYIIPCLFSLLSLQCYNKQLWRVKCDSSSRHSSWHSAIYGNCLFQLIQLTCTHTHTQSHTYICTFAHPHTRSRAFCRALNANADFHGLRQLFANRL